MAEAAAATATPAAVGVTGGLGGNIALELEKLEESRVKLEKELKTLQMDLNDTLTMNDEMAVELKKKDSLLMRREAYLKLLSEKNAAEIEQLELEEACTRQKMNHEVAAYEGHLARLEREKERVLILRAENSEHQETASSISEQISSEAILHALTIHDMNRDMGVVREKLEKQMRRELIALNDFYQNSAFSSLTERQKMEMFENAKLKDEITLQGIGIANFGLRLNKQQYATKRCNEQIGSLNDKARELRNVLSDLSTTKMSRTRMTSELTEENKRLLERMDHLQQTLSEPPLITDIQQSIKSMMENIHKEQQAENMWHARIEFLYELNAEIKPVNDKERDGKFSVAQFKFQDRQWMLTEKGAAISTYSSSSSTTTRGALDTEEAISISEVRYELEHDAMLAKALSPLKGKEGCLVSKGEKSLSEEEQTQNMAAWVIGELLKMWKATSKIVEQQPQEGSSTNQSIDELSTLFLQEQREKEGSRRSSSAIEQYQTAFDERKEWESETIEKEQQAAVFEPFLMRQPKTLQRPDVESSDLIPRPEEEEELERVGSPVESREAIEELWDTAFLDPPPFLGVSQSFESFVSGSGGQPGEGVKSWYTKQPSLQRLPRSIKVYEQNADDRYANFDIRPAAQSFELSPPLASSDLRARKLVLKKSSSSVEFPRLVSKTNQQSTAKAASLSKSESGDALMARSKVMRTSSGSALTLGRMKSEPVLTPRAQKIFGKALQAGGTR